MGTHSDLHVDETRHAKPDRVSQFSTFNSSGTDEVRISLSDWDREEFDVKRPLIVAMAQENRRQFLPDAYTGESSVDLIFDEAICDLTDFVLADTAVNPDRVPSHNLGALMLGIARKLNFRELADHVDRYSTAELEQIGLSRANGKSTYRKAATSFQKAGEFQALKHAAFIAVCVLFAEGVPIPSPVKQAHGLSTDLGPAAADFPDPPRRYAIYNLVADLLDRTTQQSQLFEEVAMENVVGRFAHSALEDGSARNYKQTAQHLFDVDAAYSGIGMRNKIQEISIDDIETVYDDIFQDLLSYILQSGAVPEPLTVSYDLVDTQSYSDEVVDEIYENEDGTYTLGALAFTDADLEFAYGLRLFESEAQRAAKLKELLRSLVSEVDVKFFFADRGFDGGDDINACRLFVPDSWVIHAQEEDGTTNVTGDVARLCRKMDPGGAAQLPNAGYNNLKPPTSLVGYSTASDDANSLDDGMVRVFFTDMKVPRDEEKREKFITMLNFAYNNRARVETLFGMIKNRFDVGTNSNHRSLKIFYFNLSVLFYNYYEIVNTVPSPELGVELDVTQREVLQAIRNVAFDGPRRPPAMDYLNSSS